MNYPLYNSSLCPDLWDKKGESYVMKKEVRERLMKIADDFVVEYLAEAKVKIKVRDVVVIGSIANYNWNKFSDIDLHLVFDYKDLDMSEEDAFTMLTAIKINWNKSHDIKIKGHDLELGVQGLEQENHSKSTYSVKRNVWLVPPTNTSPKFDKETIKAKHKMMKEKIDALLKAKDDEGLRKILEKLYVMRQAGLDKSGEYSAENIVFKILRAQGYLDKIKDHAAEIYDKEMTLNEALIDDGISSLDGKKITWMKDEDEGEFCMVPTDNDKQTRVFSLYGTKIFAAYRVMPTPTDRMKKFDVYTPDEIKAQSKKVGDDAVNLRKAVKHSDASSVSILDDLIDWSIDRMMAESKMDAKKINVIIPLGSSSTTNLLIAEKMKKVLPHAVVLRNFLQKDTWSNIQLSKNFHEKLANRRAQGKDLTHFRDVVNILKSKKLNHPHETFSVSGLKASDRLYFSLFYKIRDGLKIDSVRALRGTNILFIDDTLEAGATIIEARRAIESFSPNSVSAYILLFGRNTTKPKPENKD